MYRTRVLPAALAIVIASGAVGGLAFAEKRNEAVPADAKVSLQQAIATAEQHANGRAVSAELEQRRGAAQIEVKVAGPQGVRKVIVDAQSGQVASAQVADQDGDDD